MEKFNKKSKNNSLSFITALFFTFLVLKLTGLIDWSWWWVCAPLWFFPALFLILILIAMLFMHLSD